MPEPAVFEHKPTRVEAMRVGDWAWATIAEWCGAQVIRDGRKNSFLLVPTLHGNTRAEPGDWVVRNPDRGDFWPVDEQTFLESYQPATEDA